ncbi:MAG TPA: tetratricopeptide repeat protein, partial [Opitutaceae bacterium]|nr:tetratricopeptide repeat protein [Opitutaceae bacterium]
HAVLAIVTPMLEGEILVREKRIDEGFVQLRAAIAEEDKLKYDEPPAWLIPVRHSLGAALMAHGRHAEAVEVYREDLARLPNNGWSLFGLSEALVQQRKFDEARSVREQYQLAWSKADTTITSSCFCQPGATGQ